MGIRQLRTLVAIADTGSFRGAAERLFVTQSAVSMQMAALENQWRIKLFDRSKRPPVLHPEALAMVARARRILEEYETLGVRANSPSAALIGSLRLGVIPSVTTTVLPKVLHRTRRLYPKLRIRIEDGMSQELAFKVNQGRLDAAVVTDPTITDDPALSRRVLWRETLKLIVHRDLKSGPFDQILSRNPFIRFNAAMSVGRIIDSVVKSRPFIVDDAMELDSTEAICRMVAMKLGVAIIPENLVPRHLRSTIVTVALPAPRTGRAVSLVTRPEHGDLPAIERIYQQFREAAPPGTGDP